MMLLGLYLRKNFGFPAVHGLREDRQRIVSASALGCHSGMDDDHLRIFDKESDVWAGDNNPFNALLRSVEANIHQLSELA